MPGVGFMNPAVSVFPYPAPNPFAQMPVGFPPRPPMAAAASKGSAAATATPGSKGSAVLTPFPAPFGLPLAALTPPAPDAGTAGVISFSTGAEEEEEEAPPTCPPPPPPAPVVVLGTASTAASSAPALPPPLPPALPPPLPPPVPDAAAAAASTASTSLATLVSPPDAVTTLTESTSALDITDEAAIASTDQGPGPVGEDGDVDVGIEAEDVASTGEVRPRVSNARRDPPRARHGGGGSRAKRSTGGHAVVPHMAIVAQPWTRGESGGKITAIDQDEPVSHLGLDDLETL